MPRNYFQKGKTTNADGAETRSLFTAENGAATMEQVGKAFKTIKIMHFLNGVLIFFNLQSANNAITLGKYA